MFNVQFFHQTQLDTARFYLFALSISLSLPSSKYDHHYPISLNKNWGRFFFFLHKKGAIFEGRSLFEGGDYFKYCSLEVICFIMPLN